VLVEVTIGILTDVIFGCVDTDEDHPIDDQPHQLPQLTTATAVDQNIQNVEK
jgi:hypothetical protein